MEFTVSDGFFNPFWTEGVETVPDFVLEDVEGIEDEGGGVEDMLIMKIDPAKFLRF